MGAAARSEDGIIWILVRAIIHPRIKHQSRPKGNAQSKGRRKVDLFISRHELSTITNITSSPPLWSHFPSGGTGPVPPKPKHFPTPLACRLHGSVCSVNPPQPFFDPDGLALPLFYCYPSPRSSADGSHLELLPARHFPLAPSVEGALVALDQTSRGGESEI